MLLKTARKSQRQSFVFLLLLNLISHSNFNLRWNKTILVGKGKDFAPQCSAFDTFLLISLKFLKIKEGPQFRLLELNLLP